MTVIYSSSDNVSTLRTIVLGYHVIQKFTLKKNIDFILFLLLQYALMKDKPTCFEKYRFK